ncbi:hypothetical protein [Polaribacter porphyrae]|uniref:Uncharacterized protein n=1 Tax=Polaribacter porphyrae TaxID=1137780 RepID=A0A2S7WKY7_9FLAO|nr:hypothetical protein [Polaribacter porphyrae]PQJ78275.1 hypothetical protein BTO18_03305 [Polaribacter porphyrae]
MDTEFVNIFGLGLGLLGIILAIYFYYKSKKKKKFYYLIDSYNIISNDAKEVNNLEVFHKKNKISTLTISKILIWNSGNTPVFKKDLPKKNKISISSEKIFDFSLMYNSDYDSGLTLEKNKSSINVDFDYIEANKGFIIKLIHSGESSDSVEISCKIIGGLPLKKVDQDYLETVSLKSKIKNTIFFLLGLISFLTAYHFTFLNIEFRELLIYLSFVFTFLFIISFFKKKIPKKMIEKF